MNLLPKSKKSKLQEGKENEERSETSIMLLNLYSKIDACRMIIYTVVNNVI